MCMLAFACAQARTCMFVYMFMPGHEQQEKNILVREKG